MRNEVGEAYSAHANMQNVYAVLVPKPEGTRSLERIYVDGDNIKMCLKRKHPLRIWAELILITTGTTGGELWHRC
jgi:hypothetical protein